MSRFTVDASVAVRWFVPDQHSPQAMSLLTEAHERIAPELIFAEVSHGLLKRVRGHEIQPVEAERALVELAAVVKVRTSAHLALHAFELARKYDRSAYDALYAALAVEQGCRLVTADRRLYNALHDALPDTMLWVDDAPGALQS